MTSPESLPPPPNEEQDPRLQLILEQYGDVLILDHKNQPTPLHQATNPSGPNYCPPFVNALLGAESFEQLQQIVDALKAPK